MEWHDWLVFIILIACASYPGRVQSLEKKVKKLERKDKNQNKEDEMSKIIQSLVGKKCNIHVEEEYESDDLDVQECLKNCQVVEADEDWIRVLGKSTNKQEIVYILRIDTIQSIIELSTEEKEEPVEDTKKKIYDK